MQEVTEKQIRKRLAAELGVDLEPHKAYIRKHVSVGGAAGRKVVRPGLFCEAQGLRYACFPAQS